MAVRAKFLLVSYIATNSIGHKKETEPIEMRTYKFSPVFSQDPDSENRKFWEATPTGLLELGCVNKAVWPQLKLGAEYYLDFTQVEAPE